MREKNSQYYNEEDQHIDLIINKLSKSSLNDLYNNLSTSISKKCKNEQDIVLYNDNTLSMKKTDLHCLINSNLCLYLPRKYSDRMSGYGFLLNLNTMTATNLFCNDMPMLISLSNDGEYCSYYTDFKNKLVKIINIYSKEENIIPVPGRVIDIVFSKNNKFLAFVCYTSRLSKNPLALIPTLLGHSIAYSKYHVYVYDICSKSIESYDIESEYFKLFTASIYIIE